MNLFQRILVKLLSAKTKEEIARNEDFTEREAFGMAIKAITGIHTTLPSSTQLANDVQAIVAFTQLESVNHLVADKVAREKLAEAYNVEGKDKLNVLVGIGKVLADVE